MSSHFWGPWLIISKSKYLDMIFYVDRKCIFWEQQIRTRGWGSTVKLSKKKFSSCLGLCIQIAFGPKLFSIHFLDVSFIRGFSWIDNFWPLDGALKKILSMKNVFWKIKVSSAFQTGKFGSSSLLASFLDSNIANEAS